MAQAFTNFSGNQNGNANEPTSYLAADGLVGAPTTPFNPNNPTFSAASFPAGIASGTVINSPVISGGTINGLNPVAQITPVPVSATSAAVGPAIPLGIPAGGSVELLTFDTVTAFTGATVSAVVGSASGDASYVTAISVKNGGRVTLLPNTAAGVAAFDSVPTGSGLVLTISQGTPTATGSGNVGGIVSV